MDKNKIKETLKAKLKQEMSMTGTGASVTSGVGAGVATKYAFGKHDNKGTPKDWKAAPSIPNRKSKAMDYKELWEQEITTVRDHPASLSSDPSKSITIPKGSKVKVLIKRMDNAPEVMQLDYNGEKVNVNAGPFINQYMFKKSLSEEKVGEVDYEPIMKIIEYVVDMLGLNIENVKKADIKIYNDFSFSIKGIPGHSTNGFDVDLSNDEKNFIIDVPNSAQKIVPVEKIGIDDLMSEAYIPTKTNVEELARVEGLLAKAHEENAFSVMSAYESRIRQLKLLVAIEKKIGKQLPVLSFGEDFIDYVRKEFGYKGPVQYSRLGGLKNAREIADFIINSQSQNINEGESGFNVNKVWDFIDSKPFYNKEYSPKFNTAQEIWDEWGPKEKEMYNNFQWTDTYNGETHPKEKAALQRRKNYDTLSKSSVNEEKLMPGDRVKVVYGNEFYGQTGTIEDIHRGFVEVEMDEDGGTYSMHMSDVEKIEDVEEINENYARFRNETKTRTKPEQFHSAVKSVKKKVNEINKLFEYMDRLQKELSESEGGLTNRKYTENALNQIKEATKALFLKSTKLK